MNLESLTANDWEEIYYALYGKAVEIEQGKFDDEPGEIYRRGSETAQWAAHLRQIMTKIAARFEAEHS
jgi:hypothetical protein